MCFDNKVNYLNYVIRNIGRLPEEDEFFFEDGQDQRKFFDELAFYNMINSIELESKPSLVIGYNLILDTLDEYKMNLPMEYDSLLVEVFKLKQELNKKIENKEVKEIKKIEREILKKEKIIKSYKKNYKVKMMTA